MDYKKYGPGDPSKVRLSLAWLAGTRTKSLWQVVIVYVFVQDRGCRVLSRERIEGGVRPRSRRESSVQVRKASATHRRQLNRLDFSADKGEVGSKRKKRGWHGSKSGDLAVPLPGAHGRDLEMLPGEKCVAAARSQDAMPVAETSGPAIFDARRIDGRASCQTRAPCLILNHQSPNSFSVLSGPLTFNQTIR